MQISLQEVLNARKAAQSAKSQVTSPPIESIEELAVAYGVSMDEVARFTQQVLAGEGDPMRERRVRELTQRVESGAYQVSADDVVDMAERRALADQAALD